MQIIESLKQELRKYKPLRILSAVPFPNGDGFVLVFPDVKVSVAIDDDKLVVSCCDAKIRLELTDPYSLVTLDKFIRVCKGLKATRQELCERLGVNEDYVWLDAETSYRLIFMIFRGKTGPGVLERAMTFADISVVGTVVFIGAQRREEKNGVRRANTEFDFLEFSLTKIEEFIRENCLMPIKRGPCGRREMAL